MIKNLVVAFIYYKALMHAHIHADLTCTQKCQLVLFHFSFPICFLAKFYKLHKTFSHFAIRQIAGNQNFIHSLFPFNICSCFTYQIFVYNIETILLLGQPFGIVKLYIML